MKILEEEVEKSIQREETRLDTEERSYPDDVQQVAQELKSKHNVSKSPTIACRSTNNGVFFRSRSNSYENA